MQLTSVLNATRHIRSISWITVLLSLIVPQTFPMGLISERLQFALVMLMQSASIIFRTIRAQLAYSSKPNDTH